MSTSSSHLDIQWVPQRDDYVLTWSTDIKLYHLVPSSSSAVSHFQENPDISRISDDLVAEAVCLLPDPPHYIKCVRVYPGNADFEDPKKKPENEDADEDASSPVNLVVAVGVANGRISLRSFSSASPLKQFSPRTQRQCNDLAWAREKVDDVVTTECRMLAGAFDKARGEGGVLIFDTQEPAKINTVSSSTFRVFGREEKYEYVQATHELAQGDTCHSVAWCDSSGPNTLVAGVNNKILKLFDLRLDQSGVKSSALSTFTRAVYGVCVDPFLQYRVASQYDDQVVIWDTRNFDKPIVTLTQAQKVQKLGWSSTRAGLLSSAVQNSSFLTIHDIQSWSVGGSEAADPAVTERQVRGWRNPQDLNSKKQESHYTSFVWHPKDESMIVAVSSDGSLSAVEVCERISPSWSSEHCLMWPHGGKLRSFSPEVTQLFSEIIDISVVMQERVKKGYGSLRPLRDNAPIAADPRLSTAWAWLDHCDQLVKDKSFKNKFASDVTYPGVRTALGLDSRRGLCLKSDITYQDWNTVVPGSLGHKKVYRSQARSLAQRLCGWHHPDGEDDLEDAGGDLAHFLGRCERREEFSRAAAVAVFCLQIRTAVDILQRGAEVMAKVTRADEAARLTFTVMALSGFEQKDGSWRSTVRSSLSSIDDPYTRAMFSFLIAAEHDTAFPGILDEPGIFLSDKIAFACQFLTDERLMALVNNLWRDYKNKGDLAGLLLCGLGSESVDLLQRHLDLSGDVQTVCWLAVRGLSPALAQGARPRIWFESYRALLDAWRMWVERAGFDAEAGDARLIETPPKQVYVSCSFCGKPVGQNLQGLPSREEMRASARLGVAASRPPPSSQGQNPAAAAAAAAAVAALRPQVCRACRKPLPRCAICLMNVGSRSGLNLSPNPPGPSAAVMTSFEEFLAWCQSCRHGGHAGHIDQWFQQHSECPVSGCPCRCYDQDQNDCLHLPTPGNSGVLSADCELAPLMNTLKEMDTGIQTGF